MRALVIGVGNVLRGDDGAAHAVLARLAPRVDGTRVELLAAHQLLPEHAAAIAAAGLVVLVDAAADQPPGEVAVRAVAAGAPVRDAHGLDLPALLSGAREWYGHSPPALAVGIGAGSFELREGLSREVAAALDAAADAVVRLLAERGY